MAFLLMNTYCVPGPGDTKKEGTAFPGGAPSLIWWFWVELVSLWEALCNTQDRSVCSDLK